MNTRFEELDAPATEVVRVEGRVSRLAGIRPGARFGWGGGGSDPWPAIGTEAAGSGRSMATANPFDWIARASQIVTPTVALLILSVAMGDDGPWIVVVPVLTALCCAWLDRRIRFGFAEGFIGYRGDPEPGFGAFEEDRPAPRQGSAAAGP